MRTGTWLVGLAAVMGGWYALRDEGSPRPVEAPQLSVAGRGFALHDPAARRAKLLDLDGASRHEIALRDRPEARVVGESGLLSLIWRERDRIHAARLKADGSLGPSQSFGKRAVKMCDGVASNALRFSVGWLESDGNVWYVFGPTAPKSRELVEATAVEPVTAAARPKTTWCTLAVSGKKTVLLWRRDAALYIAACGRNCPSLPPQVRSDAARRPVLGFGCAGNGCGLATRDGQGTLHLTWVGTNGKQAWDRVLPGYRGGHVEVIGAGDRQVAVAYEDLDGHPLALRVSTGGEVTPAWRGGAGKTPSLAWIDGKLAIAYQHDGRVVTTTIPLLRQLSE